MASIYDWSTTAGSNSNSDSDINWAEGQAPSSVNNSARQMMGRLAELVADIGGSISAGGTANALTVTANSAFTTLAQGRMVAFRAASDNTTAATLNVNSIGAKAVRKMTTSGDSALTGGEIQAGGIYLVQYDTAANGSAGAWILVNPTFQALGTGDSPTFAGLTGTGAWSTSGSLSVGGAFSTNSAGTLESLIVNQSAQVGGTLTVAGVSTLQSLSVNTNTQIGGSAAITGALQAAGTYSSTTASAANVFVNSSGDFQRSTSAAKYKTDVEPISEQMLASALSLKGITYRSKCDSDDPDERHVGIVADEAHALGLTELVVYGADGDVEGFRYERGFALLLEIVKRLAGDVAELKAR